MTDWATGVYVSSGPDLEEGWANGLNAEEMVAAISRRVHDIRLRVYGTMPLADKGRWDVTVCLHPRDFAELRCTQSREGLSVYEDLMLRYEEDLKIRVAERVDPTLPVEHREGLKMIVRIASSLASDGPFRGYG